MRELQNAYLIVIMLVIIAVFTTTGCQSNTIELLDGLCFNDKDGTYICEPDIQPEPSPVMPAPGIQPCLQIERYYFDTPGIEPHEVETPKKCEGLLS
jgi:hypothetical protein